MRSNVRPFPVQKPQLEWGARIISAILYLSLGYFLRIPSGMGINLIMVLGLIYWALINQKRFRISYFLRYHILQALILNLLLTIFFLILQSAIAFLFSLFNLVGFLSALTGIVGIYGSYYLLLSIAIFMGFALYHALAAIIGRTPSIPIVSENVRYWA